MLDNVLKNALEYEQKKAAGQHSDVQLSFNVDGLMTLEELIIFCRKARDEKERYKRSNPKK